VPSNAASRAPLVTLTVGMTFTSARSLCSSISISPKMAPSVRWPLGGKALAADDPICAKYRSGTASDSCAFSVSRPPSPLRSLSPRQHTTYCVAACAEKDRRIGNFVADALNTTPTKNRPGNSTLAYMAPIANNRGLIIPSDPGVALS